MAASVGSEPRAVVSKSGIDRYSKSRFEALSASEGRDRCSVGEVVSQTLAVGISTWGEVPLVAVNMLVIPRFTALKIAFTTLAFAGVTIFTADTKLALLDATKRYLRDSDVKKLETLITPWERAAILTGSVVSGVLTSLPLAVIAILYNPGDITAPMAIICSDGLVAAHSGHIGMAEALRRRSASHPFSSELRMSQKDMGARVREHLMRFNADPVFRKEALEWWGRLIQMDSPASQSEEFYQRVLSTPSTDGTVVVSTGKGIGASQD